MQSSGPAYVEMIDFLSDLHAPEEIAAFRPTEGAQRRVSELIAKERNEGVTEDERRELDRFLLLDDVLSLLKARARLRLAERG